MFHVRLAQHLERYLLRRTIRRPSVTAPVNASKAPGASLDTPSSSVTPEVVRRTSTDGKKGDVPPLQCHPPHSDGKAAWLQTRSRKRTEDIDGGSSSTGASTDAKFYVGSAMQDLSWRGLIPSEG
ncbi:unnamed protein product [Vitrella brassicaformis CCMP3155]|uniref:Uncharacterized protein n=1 Tax=Vitrella brassicaformis (strain CCMP3155) TaxID=1169540 RepID=A0A0G4G030_VITBC|nr:unnamed protein product [Vitrella brassicaformis CCMP3155]|eukprot:CEM21199.1 unnamed protein product [Vitrella brassicaformis CCMP3155]